MLRGATFAWLITDIQNSANGRDTERSDVAEHTLEVSEEIIQFVIAGFGT